MPQHMQLKFLSTGIAQMWCRPVARRSPGALGGLSFLGRPTHLSAGTRIRPAAVLVAKGPRPAAAATAASDQRVRCGSGGTSSPSGLALSCGHSRPRLSSRRAWFCALPQSFEERWQAQCGQLRAFKEEHGHCNVPLGWADDPALGKWVAKQRVAKKRLDRGEASARITAERVAVLEGMGFEWSLQIDWKDRVKKLGAFKEEHGHCNVPQGWPEDPALGGFVNSQRDHKKKLDSGEPARGLTVERVAVLDEMGFEWAPGTVHDRVGWEQPFMELEVRHVEHCQL